jgi:hypothetical protein
VPLTSANEPAAGQPPTPEDRVASDSIARNPAFATLSAALTA